MTEEMKKTTCFMMNPEYFVVQHVLPLLDRHPMFTLKSEIDKVSILARVLDGIQKTYAEADCEEENSFSERGSDGNYKLRYLYLDDHGGHLKTTLGDALHYLGRDEEPDRVKTSNAGSC